MPTMELHGASAGVVMGLILELQGRKWVSG